MKNIEKVAKRFALILMTMLAVPLAAAQYTFVPSELLNNPIAIFLIFFAVFFSAIYFSLGKSFGGNMVIPAIIAAALSFIVAAGIQQQWQFINRPVMFWAMIFAGALIGILLILGFTRFGGQAVGLAIPFGVYGLWPVIKNSLPREVIYRMPYEYGRFLDQTWWVGAIIGIALLIYAGQRMHSVWRERRRFGY